MYIRGDAMGMKRSKGKENYDDTTSEALGINILTGTQYEIFFKAGGIENEKLWRGSHDEVYILSEAVGMNIEPKRR